MPYEIRKVSGGWKVAKKDGSETFSGKPMTRQQALKQMRALYASEKKK